MSTELVPGRISGGGAFPGYFIAGDSTTARMMPWRFAQRWLTKLSLPDIEEACGGGDMQLGERLLWKRSEYQENFSRMGLETKLCGGGPRLLLI